MSVVTAGSRRWHLPAHPTAAAARGGQWRWLAGGLALAFAIPFVLTDLASIDRDLYYLAYVAGVVLFVGAWLRFGVVAPRDLLTHHWRGGIVIGVAFVVVMGWIVQREPATAHPDGPGVRCRDRLAGRGLRVRGRRDPLRVPDHRRLLRLRREACARATTRQARRRRPRARRLAPVHGRLPPRVLRFPGREAAQAAGGRRHLERSHPRDAEPSRLADHACRAACERCGPQLRHGHVPATASIVAGSARPELQAILDSLVEGRSRIAPGATAYVVDSRGVWLGAAGVADVQSREPMPTDARMRLESVSKIWTGVLIHQLAEEGRLRLSDSVERWLPGLLPYGNRITVAQLLNHTSGLIDNNDVATNPDAYFARVTDPAVKAQLLARQAASRADPDDRVLSAPLDRARRLPASARRAGHAVSLLEHRLRDPRPGRRSRRRPQHRVAVPEAASSSPSV